MSQNAEIVKLYRAGWKPVEIAQEMRVTEWTIHHRLNRLGVERRLIGMSESDSRRAVQMYELGESMRQIGIKLGFNDKTIKKALVEAGLEIREIPRNLRT